ncbi:MAG: threonine/serine dehydratase [Actinomycetota bacterium]
MSIPAPTIDDVRAAQRAIEGLIVHTPLIEVPDAAESFGRRVLLKAETLQRTGSFKYRGATAFLARLGPEGRSRGVVAYSSGNHGQAVAAAAAHFGVSATIVMPSDAPEVKVSRTRARGAAIVMYDRAREEREAIAAGIAANRGVAIVPPYDHPWTIAGQGTAGLEIAADANAAGVTDPVVLVPAGGGGLTAGIALALAADLPAADVWTVEPELFDDHRRSFAAGERMGIQPGGRSICDALLAPTPGAVPFEVNRRLVRGSAVVSDDQVRAAIRFALEELRMVVEPGGAVGLAALLAGMVPGTRPVIVVLSGANVDRSMLVECLG